jgi:hypothetical protein
VEWTVNDGRFQKQFDANPGDRYGHRVIVCELERDVRGARRVLVRCELCEREQVTRFHVLRDGADACIACANAGYRTHEERFWDYAFPEPNSGCWLWTGQWDPFDYALFCIDGRMRKASHEALRLAGVVLLDEQVACHRCDTPPCVNPDHLYAGTMADNARDRSVRGRDGGPKRRGEGNGRAKLTAEQVAQVRALWATGRHTKRGLSRQFGVSDTQIGHIVTGRQW